MHLTMNLIRADALVRQYSNTALEGLPCSYSAHHKPLYIDLLICQKGGSVLKLLEHEGNEYWRPPCFCGLSLHVSPSQFTSIELEREHGTLQ